MLIQITKDYSGPKIALRAGGHPVRVSRRLGAQLIRDGYATHYAEDTQTPAEKAVAAIIEQQDEEQDETDDE